jgi:hypothetical protein
MHFIALRNLSATSRIVGCRGALMVALRVPLQCTFSYDVHKPFLLPLAEFGGDVIYTDWSFVYLLLTPTTAWVEIF